MSSSPTAPTLCVVVCGAGPAPRVAELVGLAQRDGWTVRLVATPAALAFLNVPALTQLCGSPVRSDYRETGDSGPRLSSAAGVIVAPATYNTINKLAAGINDTYALNVVAEAIGRGTPVVILPFVNTALAGRQPFQRSVQALRSEGVRVLLGAGLWEPHPPGQGDKKLDEYPWGLALATLGDMDRPTAH